MSSSWINYLSSNHTDYHAFPLPSKPILALLLLRVNQWNSEMATILVKCASVHSGSTSLEFSRDQLEFHTFCIRRCLQTYLLVIHTYIHFKEDISFLWKLPVSPNQYFLCKYGITLHMELGLCFYCFYAIISIIFSHSCSEWKPIIM